MSTPIVEQIAQEIDARIAEITTANGFNQDLTPLRPTRLNLEGDVAPTDGTVVILQEDPSEDDENSTDGNAAIKAWVQSFSLAAFVIASDATTTAIDTRINQVRADIEKKLTADITRGGLAIDTRIRPPRMFNEAPQATGIVINVDVHYRTREDDPYTAA